MEGAGGTGPSSLVPPQRPSFLKKSSGKSAKSAGSQRSSSSNDRSIESAESSVTVTARKSGKRPEELVASIPLAGGTRTSRDLDASSAYQGQQTSNTVPGSSGNRREGVVAGSSFQRVIDVGGRIQHVQQTTAVGYQSAVSRNTKSSTGKQPVRFNDTEDVVRRTTPTQSTIDRDTPQPIRRAKRTRTPGKSAMAPPRANAVAGPSRHRVDGPGREEVPRSSQQSWSSHPRSSFPLPIPSTSRGQPNRKTTQPTTETPPARRRSMIRPSENVTVSMKSGPIIPHWQREDEQRANELAARRHPDQANRGFIKRIGTASSGRRAGGLRTLPLRKVSTPKSYLGRNLTLRKQGERDNGSDSSDSSMEADVQPPQLRPVRLLQTGLKAARKREWPPPLFEPESSDESVLTVSSEADEPEPDTAESDDDLYASVEEDDQSAIEEIVDTAQRAFSPVEIEILPGPPRPPSPLSTSDNMMKAIEALSLSSVRMQNTKQLPFMLRNLRQGFLGRCRQLGVPAESSRETARLRVNYEYRSEVVKTRLREWLCPLCELHGPFPTREMLACHLSWDHQDAPAQWLKHQSGAWNLRLEINYPPSERGEENADHLLVPVEQPLRQTTLPPSSSRFQADYSSLFPFVTLSPSERQPTPALDPALTFPSRAGAQKPPTTLADITVQTRASPIPVTSLRDSRSLTVTATPPPSSRSRSITAASTTTTESNATTATATTASTPRPGDFQFPVPPPKSNPLGPAAQPPYLPAKSEYGGPDAIYSCRPGGPHLYDLLNTLPLEPFGVLAWDVLDREDEIYDSDNVKDEYKVMHALWGRWIVLNRNNFIKDYYKGTKAFIDFYWRMIHRAAGWDALRYWLLMLVVNRFITGSDVASLLKHYESLTGMDMWYD